MGHRRTVRTVIAHQKAQERWASALELVREMIDHPDRAVGIAAKAVGCTISRKENEVLTVQDGSEPGLQGLARYRRAGIVVVDTATKEPAW